MSEEELPAVGYITIKNAVVRYRNFSGKGDDYNPPGTRHFSVFLGDDLANALLADGWNVKFKKPVHPEDPPQAYLKVFVRFTYVPPKIIVITSEGKRSIDENEVSKLDWADVRTWNIIISPYHWTVGKKTGIKAYLKTMTAYISEDELEKELRNVPDLPDLSSSPEENG